MTIKELKNRLEKYDDDLEISFVVITEGVNHEEERNLMNLRSLEEYTDSIYLNLEEA